MGWEVQKGGDVCIPMADSRGCIVETNTILQSDYPPIKTKLKKAKPSRTLLTTLAVWKYLPPGSQYYYYYF